MPAKPTTPNLNPLKAGDRTGEQTLAREDSIASDAGAPSEPLCLLISTRKGVTITPLERDREYTIGRASSAHVIVSDRTASREHMRLSLFGRKVTLTDLHGANGTRVNGRRLEPGETMSLQLGAVVEMGATTVILQRAEGLLNDDGTSKATPSAAPITEDDESTRVVRDDVMLRLYSLLDAVAPSMLNVLILGETGVGKEVFASAIHAKSERRHRPFVELNCASVPESLFESELFGHEKGAFSGAVQSKPGVFESADGGTVFLDEVGEIPLVSQAKLLRVLETREVQRVGATRTRKLDVRFIAATNRDLRALILDQRFRQDLYFRLNGIALTIPPLRKRVDDILPLAEHFAGLAAARLGRAAPAIEKDASELLRRYAWPGNVRELRNVIDRAVVVSHKDVVSAEDLALGDDEPMVRRVSSKAPAPKPTPSPDARREAMPRIEGGTLSSQVDAFQKRLIVDALEQSAGNQTKAARLLGISRRVLLLRIEQYGLPRPRKEPGHDEG